VSKTSARTLPVSQPAKAPRGFIPASLIPGSPI
jgi:hypothetical protein